MKKLFIVGGGEMQVPIIKKAKELGNFCIVSDLNPNAPGFKYADLVVNISTTDLDHTLEIASQHNIDGILTTSDYPVRTVAYVCEKLGLKGLSEKSAVICTDKHEQRRFMEDFDLYTPWNFLISSLKEIEEISNRIKFPSIVKPIDSSASRGVRRVETYDELIDAYHYAIEYSQEKKVIIEEFIEGPEYSVECLIQDAMCHVVSITEKSIIGTEENYFVESKHVIPAQLLPKEHKLINEYVKSAVQYLKLDNSSAHVEIKLNANGPVLIEIGARLGGDFITSDLVPLATGVDMLENVIKIALDEPIKVAHTKALFSGVVFVTSANYKKAAHLISTNNESIVSYELKPYQETLIKNSLDRLGHLIAVSKERAELLALLNI